MDRPKCLNRGWFRESIPSIYADTRPIPIYQFAINPTQSKANPYGRLRLDNPMQSFTNRVPIQYHSVRTLYEYLMELVLYGSHWSLRGTIIHPPASRFIPINCNKNPNPTNRNANPMSLQCQSYTSQKTIVLVTRERGYHMNRHSVSTGHD